MVFHLRIPVIKIRFLSFKRSNASETTVWKISSCKENVWSDPKLLVERPSFAEELTAEEKEHVKAEIKAGLESLQGKIPGLITIKVNTNGLASSNADLMLDSSFEDEASLKGYAVHPEHVKVADGKVRPFTKTRICLDYEV